eukprot:20446-Heterococcus_DN1.PRE.1
MRRESESHSLLARSTYTRQERKHTNGAILVFESTHHIEQNDMYWVLPARSFATCYGRKAHWCDLLHTASRYEAACVTCVLLQLSHNVIRYQNGQANTFSFKAMQYFNTLSLKSMPLKHVSSILVLLTAILRRAFGSGSTKDTVITSLCVSVHNNGPIEHRDTSSVKQ